jgi:hypothetical protein
MWSKNIRENTVIKNSHEGFHLLLLPGIIAASAVLTFASGKYAETKLPKSEAVEIVESHGNKYATVTDTDIFGVRSKDCGKNDFFKL